MRIIDASGLRVYPGFIDAHSHIGISEEKKTSQGDECNEATDPIGGQFAFIKTSGRRIDDMVVQALSAIKIAFGENPMTNYGPNGNTPSSRMGIASLIREELTLAKQYFSNNNESKKTFTMECYRDLFEGRIPIKAHVHRADDIFTAIRIRQALFVLPSLPMGCALFCFLVHIRCLELRIHNSLFMIEAVISGKHVTYGYAD